MQQLVAQLNVGGTLVTTTPAINDVPFPLTSRRKVSVRRTCIASALLVLIALGVYYINEHWPYRYRNVEPLLEEVFASRIKMGSYHRFYFPEPGFVARGLTLRRNSAPDLPPVGSADSLVVQGRWMDLLLFRKRVRLVDVEGLHVVIPPVGSLANKQDFPPGSSADFRGPTTVVEQFDMNGATLDIMRTDGNRYSFPIRQLIIHNLRNGEAITYSVDMQNAKPVGHIQASGSFGPLIPEDLGATRVTGDFTFSSVNLADIHGINGTLSATGKFHGTLAAIDADTTSETPDFAVGKGQATQVSTWAHGTVNGLNANIALTSVEAHTGSTTVSVKGRIVGSPKVTNLDISVTKGRAQDLLRPFLHDEVPIVGPIRLRGHAYLAPARERAKFLQRLFMDGTFDIPAERLTNRKTEQELSEFSHRAQNLKSTKIETKSVDSDATASADVLSSLRGRAQIRDGIVSTQRLTFQMPGAEVDLNGTFNLHDRSAHLLGNLRMQSDISHVTTGFKSMLMKPLIPFFKKDNAGAVIPIAITGAPPQYKVSQNILHRK